MINIDKLLAAQIIKSKGNNFEAQEIDWKTSSKNKKAVLFFKYTANSYKYLDELLGFNLVIFDDVETYEKSEVENKILISKKNWLESQKLILDQLYPLKKKKIIAITGTNGKTSVCCYLERILLNDGKKVLRVGTLGEYLNGEKISESSLTTPSFIDIRKLLSSNVFDVAIFEASSHSLEQQRFYKIEFSLGGWTNFTQDHLDYHGTMENYYKSKIKIKNHLQEKLILTSEESLYLKNPEVFKKSKPMVFTKKEKEKNLALCLDFNKKNIELSYALFKELLGKESDLTPGELLPARGRFNFIHFNKSLIVIDFAHTPDALEKICSSLKKIDRSKKLNVLFGCGGDRDRSKRKYMAEAVQKYADKIYITSDNPRSEEPMQIINDALAGIKDQRTISIEADRTLSIKTALAELDGNILLIAGKGHENYQEVGGIKNYYSDFDVVNSVIEASK